MIRIPKDEGEMPLFMSFQEVVKDDYNACHRPRSLEGYTNSAR